MIEGVQFNSRKYMDYIIVLVYIITSACWHTKMDVRKCIFHHFSSNSDVWKGSRPRKRVLNSLSPGKWFLILSFQLVRQKIQWTARRETRDLFFAIWDRRQISTRLPLPARNLFQKCWDEAFFGKLEEVYWGFKISQTRFDVAFHVAVERSVARWPHREGTTVPQTFRT